MANILYIAPFLQNDNWGKLSNDLITILTKDHNVALRPVYYIDNIVQPSNLHMELMNKQLDHIDTVVQTVLPSFFVKTKEKSILAVPEDVKYQSYFNIAEQIADDVIILHDLANLNQFEAIKPLELPAIYDNYRVYYTFADLNEDESLEEIILSYSAYENKYQDLLIIGGNFDHAKTMEYINALRKQTGRFIDLDSYPEICVISSSTPESQMAIHKRGHVYVPSSRFNSSYNKHIEYAMCLENSVYGCSVVEGPMIKETRPFPDMFICNDRWNYVVPNKLKSIHFPLQKFASLIIKEWSSICNQ